MDTTDLGARHVLSIPDQEKLEFSAGIDAAQIWVDQLRRRANKLKGSQAKSELVAILSCGKHYEIAWADPDKISSETPGLDKDQLEAIVKARNKQCAAELLQVQDCRVAVNAFLHSLMGKTSLEVLKADPEFDKNDLGKMDPVVSWSRIMATHILEREGPGIQKQIISVNKLLNQFSAMRQNAAVESITEYYQRIERAKRALSTSGLDVDKVWLDTDEKKVIHMLHSLDPSRYGGLIRDVLNGVVTIPANVTDLLTLARDRKEIAYGSKRDTTLLSEERQAQDPLQPYEWLSYEEWSKLPSETRDRMSAHNTRIEKAAELLADLGWKDGRWKRSTRSPESVTDKYLTAVERKKSKWNNNARKPKQEHVKSMATKLHEDVDSDNTLCLMVTCTPTLNPEGVHQPPTRGIHASDDIVFPERGSRGSPPLSVCSRVMGCSDATVLVTKEPELVDLTEDERTTIPRWDRDCPSVDPTQLTVRESVYRAANAHRHVVPIGRCLTCNVDIKDGQEIGVFMGETIPISVAEKMTPERGSYLIDMAVEDEPSNIEVLDCYQNAQGKSPTCKMSMANDAIALYNRKDDKSLSEEDNNAAVTVVFRGGVRTAVMYATRKILAGEEIMWNYGNGQNSLSSTPTKPTIASDEQSETPITAGSCDILMEGMKDIRAAEDPNGETETKCLAVTARDSFDTSFVILDCASGTHICKSKDHAHNIRPCKGGRISGISGEHPATTYTKSCEFVDAALGRMPLVQTAAANILSLASAKDSGFKAEYNDEFDEFTLTSPRGGETYRFGRITHGGDTTIGMPTPSKFYVMSLSTNTPPSNSELTVMLSTNESELGVQDAKLGVKDAEIGVREKKSERQDADDDEEAGVPETDSELTTGIDTTAINARRYTKSENQRALTAKKMIASMGYPPMQVAIQQVRTMRNCPVSERDVRRCFEIYGTPVQHIKGSTKKQTPSYSTIDLGTGQIQREQVAEMDLMFYGGSVFLVAILTPLEYSMCVPIKDKGTEQILDAVERVFVEAKAKGFNIQVLKSDNEKALSTSEIASQLAQQKTTQDHTAPGQHASRAERRIQFIKQKARTICQLPYKLSKEMMKHGVLAANRYTNMQKASSSVSPLTPREKFLGRQSDYKRDVRMPFGSYCQCTTPNTSANGDPRTEACVFLYPKEATVPSYRVMRVSNGAVITRTQLIQLPMPDAIASSLDRQAEHDILDHDDELHTDTAATHSTSTIDTHNIHQDVDFQEVTRDVSFLPSSGKERWIMEDLETNKPTEEPNSPSQKATGETPQPNVQVTGHPDEENEMEMVVQVDDTPVKPQPRRSQRVYKRESEKQALDSLTYWTEDMDEYALLTSSTNMTCEEAESAHGDAATESIRSELQQLVDKEFAKPIPSDQLTPTIIKSAIRSKMFVKEKVKPDGTTDKIKSRLVARGDQQDRTLYEGEDLSATTVTCMSVFTLIAIAAHEGRKICTADVGGAYLNASMGTDGPPVYMSIEPKLAHMLTEMDARYKKAVRANGTVIVQLEKCLYGCIESARKWQENVLNTMNDNKLEPNTHDPCVLNKTCRDGAQLTIAIYVDDILMTSTNEEEMQEIIGAIKKRYGDVKSHQGEIVEFLGMCIDMSTPGSASITMKGMERSIVEESGVEEGSRRTKSPAADNIFDIDEDSPILPEQERKGFHASVARLLYIAKRVRPECLMAVSFLTTRVTKATMEDKTKLDRVINYLRSNPERGITLTPGATGIVATGYFDAAYGIHEDGKSHTGACLTIGDSGPVSVESTKQSIVTKSSTEAELVATSDSANTVLYLRNFLIAQGYPHGPCVVYQDNLSCMTLLDKGKSTSKKTRHIPVRYFWTKERVDTGEMTIVHRATALMGPANVLTKPTHGAQFEDERRQLTNWQ